MHWNGTKWKVFPTPDLESGQFSAVTAFSPSDAWAVGSFSNPERHDALDTLTEHWNGSAWSIVPSPNPGEGGHFFLTGASGSSSTDVWAAAPELSSRGPRRDAARAS